MGHWMEKKVRGRIRWGNGKRQKEVESEREWDEDGEEGEVGGISGIKKSKGVEWDCAPVKHENLIYFVLLKCKNKLN